jgi:3-phenylpropionate/trans-cinnamate dioxygenase ferredoxin reductase subunit
MRERRDKVVIVGGGQAGCQAVTTLRGEGQAGGRLAQALVRGDGQRFAVTLVCQERHPPYERPPLSKGVLLGTSAFESCLIWPQGDEAWRAVDLRLGVSADAIDRKAKTVHLDDGTTLDYDYLVLATGSRVRRLKVPGSNLGNVHSLRSVDQALAIAEGFAKGKRLIVVGGGFIGLEIAASARLRDLDTTVVEASDRLLARVVPARIASLLAKRHESEGVTLRMGAMVERFIANSRGAVKSVQLSTGEILACDIAVVGVGVSANVELAVEAGLEVDVGIRADASLRTSDPAIFACGDVAMFWHPLYERNVRVEAWQNAEDHAKVVAGVLAGKDAVSDTVPFFWSDQYDLSLQIVGLPHLGSSVVARAQKDGAVILFHLEPNGRIVGATGLGTAGSIGRDIRLTHVLIAHRAHPDRAVLMNPDARLKALLNPDMPAAIASRPGRGAAQPLTGESVI